MVKYCKYTEQNTHIAIENEWQLCNYIYIAIGET